MLRRTLAVLLIVVFVSITIFVWFPPTYKTVVGYKKHNGFVMEPIYGIRLELKNFLLNVLPWIFFSAYLIVSKER